MYLRYQRESETCCRTIPGTQPLTFSAELLEPGMTTIPVGETRRHVPTAVDPQSYLAPFIETLRVLKTVRVLAGHHASRAFLLNAHLITISGDMPAISKVGAALTLGNTADGERMFRGLQLMMFKWINAKLTRRFCKSAATPGLTPNPEY
jgi:hypothetical protein